MRQLFSKEKSDGTFVDFRKHPDLPMDKLGALIEASAELKPRVKVAADVNLTAGVSFKRFDKATSLKLNEKVYGDDIETCVEKVKEIYASKTGKNMLRKWC